ncbi:MAG: hypothetical protein ACRCSE_05715 [Vibrio sp.]
MIYECLESIQKHLGAELGDLVVSVELHGGRFDQSELNRFMLSTPCIAVAPLNIKQALEVGSGQQDAEIQVGVYIITSSHISEAFKEQMTLVGNAMGAISGHSFAHTIRDPQNLSGQNLYTGSLDEVGASMWLISFDVELRTGELNDD